MVREMRLLGLLVVACGVGCGADDVERSTGLEDSEIQRGASFPSDGATGLLFAENTSLCTGTLIAPNVVLTAAHCLDSPIKTFSTGAGLPLKERAVPEGMKSYDVAETLAHPSYGGISVYSGPVGFDMALVRLAQPITDVATAALATDVPAAGTECKAIGFGRHTENGIDTFAEKRIATVRIDSVDERGIYVTAVDGLSDIGDSGGPLSCAGFVDGTVSVVSMRAEPAWVMYMRTDAVRPWIESVVAAWQ